MPDSDAESGNRTSGEGDSRVIYGFMKKSVQERGTFDCALFFYVMEDTLWQKDTVMRVCRFFGISH